MNHAYLLPNLNAMSIDTAKLCDFVLASDYVMFKKMYHSLYSGANAIREGNAVPRCEPELILVEV